MTNSKVPTTASLVYENLQQKRTTVELPLSLKMNQSKQRNSVKEPRSLFCDSGFSTGPMYNYFTYRRIKALAQNC